MTEKTTISRRTVAKGIAWAVPAVAVTAAVPAYATSPQTPPVAPDVPNASGCKWPGGAVNCKDPLDKAFRIYIPFDNNTADDVTVTIAGAAVTAGGSDSRDLEYWPGLSLAIPAGGQKDFWITWHDDNSGNNKTMTVSYYYTVTSGAGVGTRFPSTGSYSIPVAKEFSATCSGTPEPTIKNGPPFVPNTGHSNCPPAGAGSLASTSEAKVTPESTVVPEPTASSGSAVSPGTAAKAGPTVTPEPTVTPGPTVTPQPTA